jgi:hypothetical protein
MSGVYADNWPTSFCVMSNRNDFTIKLKDKILEALVPVLLKTYFQNEDQHTVAVYGCGNTANKMNSLVIMRLQSCTWSWESHHVPEPTVFSVDTSAPETNT